MICEHIKTTNVGARYNSRLVVKNYGDKKAALIAPNSLTVQRFSQKLALFLAACLDYNCSLTGVVTQAYTQSKSRLKRDVYIRPPVELNLSFKMILKVFKLL